MGLQGNLVTKAGLLLHFVTLATCAPPGFPATGNGLWYTKPADSTKWSQEYLPIGNGYLAAMTPGGTAQEITQLNIESLWSGGPFQDPSYNGGNSPSSQQSTLASAMQSIRNSIWSTGSVSDVEALAVDPGAYGSYAGAGYLVSTLNVTGDVSGYGRWLDLDLGVARTIWTQAGQTFSRETFCSHPSQACVQHTTTTSKSVLPSISYSWANAPEGLPASNITCLDKQTFSVRGSPSSPGLLYELIGRVQGLGDSPQISCSQSTGNATVTITGAREAWITWVGGTNFDQNAGDAAHGFSFKGADPHESLVSLVNAAATSSVSYSTSWAQHQADYQKTLKTFSLNLGQTPNLNTSTDQIKAAYATDTGNPYLEWVLFNYGRYLLASSARGNLPANLQGKWADGLGNAWSADYHSNINIQMNYWSAEMSGLDVTASLWTYFEKNWAPRGAQTAKTMYNISRGWVTHNEMNIFGHTGMKLYGNSAEWANYPESAVWMMIHVFDHFDYTGDVAWWKMQGWPLLKGVASFHLDKLLPDQYSKDNTLVVAPCNSPEQPYITLGCAHAQQMIWQLFNAVEKGFAASGDTDMTFLNEVRTKRATMDKGLRIGSWGQLQEWKIDKDSPTDTHRHLSHLIGLYPGYAITGYDASIQGGLIVNGTKKNYTRSDIISAATTSLIHRGDGTGSDADSGWEKAWRAACYAQLGDSVNFYHILTLAVYKNFASNLFSLYRPGATIFQIDANLGFPGAVLNALIQAPDVATLSAPLTITLLPALPANWANGEIKNARVRGGMTLSMKWSLGKAVSATVVVDGGARGRNVQVVYGGRVVSAFASVGGMSKTITF